MTSLAKIRIKINKCEKDLEEIKEEFVEIVNTIEDNKTTPLGNKKETDYGN